MEIGMLYETSGAKDFKEFSQAFLVARNLRFNPQLVLLALWEQGLEEILQDFGTPGFACSLPDRQSLGIELRL